jgi:hypothetical protein
MAVLAASALCAGCTTTVAGTARPARASGGPGAQQASLVSVLPTERENSPVREAATANFWNYDFDAAASSANVGAVRLASANDAQSLFSTFAQRWRDCQGKTVVGHTHDSANTELYSRIENVVLSGPVLSATIIVWDNHHTPESPNERAVGVKANVIVEADVAITKPRAQAEERAVDVVKLMLDKIADVG